jgi:hypothetical protein
MTKLVLPAIINPPTIRKDGSISLKFDSRELSAEEYMIVMGFRNTEGWLAFQPNEGGIPDLPETNAEVEDKTPSERLRNVLFVWYKQETEKGKFVGLFETFKKEKMERIIEGVKSKLE